ncbi:NACHT domain-containing protein [Nostoc sp. LEGE 12450]|nr:NACHT domain-containing protein [Nostoc sp. LEGE 12450]
MGEGITYRTEQVYVPLGLVERKKQSRRKEDVSPEKGSELYHETEIKQTFEPQQFLEQVLRDRQSPQSKGKRIAIIGEPGAGKTTLLQQIAQWVLKEIEQSVVIWVSLTDLRLHDLESYLLEVWLQAIARTAGQAEASTQVKDDFVAQFNQGLVWLVLDGVDEMQALDDNPLEEIERQFRQGGLLQQARIVLSCRLNLWDGGSNALVSFDSYRTLEFSSSQQVEQFISNWFGCQPSAEIQTGQQLCVALREPGKERIRDLVKNPLRLTLLCFNWYLDNGNLPQTKAELYEQFVADFYEWKKSLFVTTGEQRRSLNAALGKLAREAIDKEETKFRLRQEFLCEYLGEPDDVDSLFWLALQLGWLNKVGVDAENWRKDVYAFFHPTFQEYFAALSIKDWHYFLNHIPENPSHSEASYRSFKPHWEEVILLWLGRKDVAKDIKEDFIKSLIEFEDGFWDFYGYQAYMIVANSIEEFLECSLRSKIIAIQESDGTEIQNIDEVIWKKLRPLFISFSSRTSSNIKFEYDFYKFLLNYLNLDNFNLTTKNLIELQRNPLLIVEYLKKDKNFSSDVLIKQDELDEIQYLVSLLNTSQDVYLRRITIINLSRAINTNPSNFACILINQNCINLNGDIGLILEWMIAMVTIEDSITAKTIIKLLVNDRSYLLRKNSVFVLKRCLATDVLNIIIKELKTYLADETYKEHSELRNDCFNILFHYAQKMTYPAFYNAWHSAAT